MALTSDLLVMIDGGEEETRTAGLWYFGTAELSFLALLVMFLLLVPAGGGSTFAGLSAGAATQSPALRGCIFVLAVVGFGSKIGLAPLHVWPPRAKAAAPSHVSALMSGVMINAGIYGLLRMIVDVMGGGPAWWGIVLLALGSVSALLGVLGALIELDLKRLLALSTVENAGIILVALGAGLVLHAAGLPALAGLAIAAALFHTVNHTCFKGLLFLQAGSVVRATGTRNLERMGGLIKRMPQTAMLFLVGAVAIAALPPLNGFASEWLIFQALLGGTQIPRPGLAIGLPVAAGVLALSSGLAAAVFVKAFGIGFLAMPRSDAAEAAQEAPASMRVAGWLLAGCCVALGVGATGILPTLYRIVDSMAGWSFDVPAAGLWMITPRPLGQFSPLLLAILLTMVAAATALAVGWISRQPLRRVDTWGCGRIRQTPRMEYTASAFAEPLRRVFAELYRPSRDLAVNVHPASPNFVQSMTFTSDVKPLVEPLLYAPVLRLWRAMAFQARRLQAGSVHLYLGYMIAALLAALAFAWWLR
jgi:formate hydrogenlyase subunit 3/multisubunit Na+/H+ antiporter MnhD subunit